MTRNTQTQGTVKKEDRRVRRTKKMLTQALTKLMQEKQVKDITVKELTELADMNRGTFYLYYKDVYDMLERLEDNLFASLDQILEPKTGEAGDSTRQMLLDLFNFIGENQEMCRMLLSPHGDMQFLHRLNGVIREKCLNYFKTIGIISEDELFDYYYSFVVFGCAGLIRSWVNGGCKESTETMADLVCRLMTGIKAFEEKAKE